MSVLERIIMQFKFYSCSFVPAVVFTVVLMWSVLIKE